MSRVDDKFRQRVFRVVGMIPKSHVMTYGQIAAYCGAAWAAWEVGQIAHFGKTDLPWQRVVSKNGRLANGYPGGRDGHKADLEAEGIEVSEDYVVNVGELLWQPPANNP